jgi:hypothetical protein
MRMLVAEGKRMCTCGYQKFGSLVLVCVMLNMWLNWVFFYSCDVALIRVTCIRINAQVL